MTVATPGPAGGAGTQPLLDLGAEPDEGLLRAFYDELYMPAFPAPEHREGIDVWIRELWPEASSPRRRWLIVAGSDLKDPARRRLWGGHMFEYYPDSRCGLLSYIVVATDRRGQGLGRRLMEAGLSKLSEAARAEGEELRAVFAECIDPVTAAAGGRDHEQEAWQRLDILRRLGARVLDVRYTAPALGPDQDRARDLLLLSMAPDPQVGPPARTVVTDFLKELYRDLGVADPEADPDFQAAVAGLDDEHAGAVEIWREEPGVKLASISIALHFVRRRPAPHVAEAGPFRRALEFVQLKRPVRREPPRSRRPDPLFNSFERDLVSYAYRDIPPFASHALRRPSEVDILFPPSTEIRSEGGTIRLSTADLDTPGGVRHRRLRLLQSRTEFSDGVVVDHLVMTNMGSDDPAAVLNEYDAVKLLKLTGGGESYVRDSGLRFANRNGEAATFGLWLAALERFEDAAALREDQLRAATVMITTGADDTWAPVYDLVSRLESEPDEVASAFRTLLEADDPEGQARAQRLKACEGIVCNLLNFGEIDHLELADALEPAIASSEFLLWLQKSTLLCLTTSDRVSSLEACRREIGITPYLLAPHAVLLHNQEVLHEADDVLRAERREDSRRELDGRRSAVVQRLRKELLPNVFHYRTERLIFDVGDRDRGLQSLAGALERGLTQLDGEIAERERAAQTRQERALTIVFGLLSATAAGDLVVVLLSDAPRWHLVVHGGVLAVVIAAVLVFLAAAGRR